MPDKFRSFVIFAEMRTGSNLLEENLNQFDALTCVGEAFNPHFIGYPEQEDLFGITQGARDQNPAKLLDALESQPHQLVGFRYFHNHDARVFDRVVNDPSCAKIVLTRNPIESFVSWKIASATGQWKLTNATHLKEQPVHIDPEEFSTRLGVLQTFQVELLNRLQKTGQTAFNLAYEDVQDLEVINGLGRFLGVDQELPHLSKRLKKQNPRPMSEKIENFEEVEKALARLDQFNLSRTPNFEPRRGPNVPQIILTAKSSLMFFPIPMGPTAKLRQMLAQMDGVEPGELRDQLSQKELRKWKRQHKNHKSFSVVRHPVLRAYKCFCDRILNTGAGSYPEIRKTLRRVHNLPIPEGEIGPDFGPQEMKHAFASFLVFVKANLGGQTAIRVDGSWASQTEVVAGFSEFLTPDMIIREHALETELGFLALQTGALPDFGDTTSETFPVSLSEFYDDEIEALVKDAYQKDYLNFGYAPFGKY